MKISGGVLLLMSLFLVQGQWMSQKKCNEYRNLTKKKITILSLTAFARPETMESFNCSKTVDLIVGGENAQPGEFPHHALLGRISPDDPAKYQFFCGGSLISEKFVLTAAHCLKDGSPDVVRLGANNLANKNDNSVDYEVKNCSRHPKHNNKRSYDDIALIELKEAVEFDMSVRPNIRPACLWTEPTINVKSVIATGFGLTEDAGNYSDILQKVNLTILPKTDCRAQFLSNSRKFTPERGIAAEQLCIGSKAGEGKDTCNGDSGGPVQVLRETKGCTYHVLGITSMGSACGMGKSNAIYTFVAPYIKWIEKTVWG